MLKKICKKQKFITRMIEKYAIENRDNYLEIKKGMRLYEDYLTQIGVKPDSRKIITVDKFNISDTCEKVFSK